MSCKDVHCGFWINWTHGKIVGSTLTLQQKWGFILVSSLVLLVGVAGSNFWGMVCYALHQMRAVPDERDDIHHQIQVLLRNSADPGSAAASLSQMAWNRKRMKPAPLGRIVPFWLLSIFHLIMLTAAGLFASQALIVGDDVLARGPACGWAGEVSEWANFSASTQSLDTINALIIMTRSTIQKSYTYSRSCYGEDAEGTSSLCDMFVKRHVNSTIDLETPCPFPGDVCSEPAVMIDSGLIDSNVHLGISAPPADKVYLRKTTTCAPLKDEKYIGSQYDPVTNHTYATYAFGGITYAPNSAFPQYTFNFLNSSDQVWNAEYDITVQSHFIGNDTTSTFKPIPDLDPGAGDLIIMGLQNVAYYIAEVRDPWFQAVKSGVDPNYGALYYSTNPLSFLSCIEQYQICTKHDCTALTGLYDMKKSDLPSLKKNSLQNATYDLLWNAIRGAQIRYTNQVLGRSILLANDNLWGYVKWISAPLPDKQWQSEAINMHNISMAALQRRVVEYASPTDFQVRPGTSSLSNISPPDTEAARSLCSKIKIRTAAYTSFSVLGISLIISLTIFLVALNMSLVTIVDKVKKRWTREEYKSLEWTETGAFQLHRMASEGRGIGPWGGKKGDIPKTEKPGLSFSLTGLSITDVSGGKDEKKSGRVW